MPYKYLFMDYETFSLANLKEVGLDNYAKDPSTGISVCCWALDGEEIEAWLPHISLPPKKFLDALRNPKILKVAWHSQFEYNLTRYDLPKYTKGECHIPFQQWRDPIVLAHHLSLPGKLEKVAKILKMKELKDERGEELKKMFCMPVSKGGEMTLFGIAPPLFRDAKSHPREFAEYVEYCRQDVRATRDLWYRMLAIPMPEIEWTGWILDQYMNEYGMPAKRQRAANALSIANRFVTEQKDLLKKMTGLENPNSDDQMKGWLSTRGYSWGSLNAKFVQAEMDNPQSTLTPEAKAVLAIRKDARKSSYKKLETFLNTLSSDDRLRYQFRYMGAPRTGRWAGGSEEGKSFQAQNMSRGEKAVKKKLKLALQLVDNNDYDGILKEFTNIPDKSASVTPVSLVITLLRSLFEAKPGKKLAVSDLNAIENRVLGWAAGCKSILDVFRTCNQCGSVDENTVGSFLCPKCGCSSARCPYISFGTKMFNKKYDDMWAAHIAGTSDDRQNSKPPVLGAGYGLGGGEMYKNENGDMVRGGLWGYAKNVCGVDMPKDMAHKAVKIFRDSYPEVVQMWTDMEEAFKQVLIRGGVIKVGEVTWDKKEREWVKHPSFLGCVITFTRKKMEDGGWLMCMQLPSGRSLHYLNAVLKDETRQSKTTGRDYTVQTIYYEGIEHSATQGADGQTEKKKHKWGLVKTYGGKLVENAVQAISRDLLLSGIILAADLGFAIWGLFHDEIATEVDDDPFGLSVNDLSHCMTVVPFWAPGLLLGAEGYESKVYKKG